MVFNLCKPSSNVSFLLPSNFPQNLSLRWTWSKSGCTQRSLFLSTSYWLDSLIMTSCPCCSGPLLRHIRHQEKYWFCRHCWQEMPALEETLLLAPVKLNNVMFKVPFQAGACYGLTNSRFASVITFAVLAVSPALINKRWVYQEIRLQRSRFGLVVKR